MSALPKITIEDDVMTLQEVAASMGEGKEQLAVLKACSDLEDMRRVLKFIASGIERGKVPDQSVLRWQGREGVTPLSTIIAETLK